MRRSGLLLLAAALLAPAGSAPQLSAQPPRMTPTVARDTIAARLRNLGGIHTPEGIDTLEQLDVNGSTQWIGIRGLNRDNPLLLVLHGGPGSALLGMTWAYQKPWEDFFTVVNWEQRGVGKNFSAADSARLGATLSSKQLVDDAEVVVQHLRRTFGNRKIIVLGFSYGTSIGPFLVQRHPEWYAAYVSVGQMSTADNERINYQEVLRRARAKGDTAVVRELLAMAPYPPADRAPNYRELNVIRRYTAMFDGNWYGKQDLSLYYALPAWGPAYTLEEAINVGPGMGWMGKHLVDSGNHRPTLPDRFDVPVVMLHGRYDLMTTYDGARSYFDRLTAPKKEFITFERSAHFVMFEQPGLFLLTMVNKVLPLAGGAKSFAPR